MTPCEQNLFRFLSLKLTMNIYTHVAPEEQAAAIKSLPGLGDLKKVE